jgi:hypothetical protein
VNLSFVCWSGDHMPLAVEVLSGSSKSHRRPPVSHIGDDGEVVPAG